MHAGRNTQYRILISGMTCQHCVNNVEKVATNINGVSSITIDLQAGEALVDGGQPEELIQAISDAGYPAKAVLEPPEIAINKNTSNRKQASSETKSQAARKENNDASLLKTIENNQENYAIAIDDMTCSSCVNKVEKAILSVPGVTTGTVNLIDKSAQVSGGQAQDVVNAIINHGYHAHLVKQSTYYQSDTINSYQLSIVDSNFPKLLEQIVALLLKQDPQVKVDILSSDSKSSVRFTITTQLSPVDILVSLKKSGYTAIIHERHEDDFIDEEKQTKKEIKRSWLRAILAGSVGGSLMLGDFLQIMPELNKTGQIMGMSSQLFWFLIALVCLFTMWFSGKNYYLTAIKQARYLSANMDTLVALGTSAAWLSSLLIIIIPDFIPGGGHLYLDAGVIILAFLQFGHALEVQAKRTTSLSIASIIELAPKTARVIKDNVEVELAVSFINVDDIVKVKPGERIPLDGTIISGSSAIDESMLTGEAVPLSKSTGDEVTAGTINKLGSFSFIVTKTGKDTTLAHIVSMVKQAQLSKPEIGRLVDKIASIFVPIVILISMMTFIVWLNIGPEPQLAYALTTAIAVLVIACPCALGLATPIAIMMGTSKAAQFNILIKNSDALQTASHLNYLVVDKTGTLTQGKPKVTNIITNHQLTADIKVDEHNLLQLALSLENHSEHPLAEAIIHAAEEKGLEALNTVNFLAVEGRGIQANIAGQAVLLGSKAFMQDNKVMIPEQLLIQQELLEKSATTIIWLARNGQIWGILGLKDPVREDTMTALNKLKEQNITVVMCTGDSHKTANAVATELGINKVYSQVLPADKLNVVKELQAKGYKVGMVGDGINDSPALTQADTGFAIGSGTDVAIENADITLAGNSLMNVSVAIDISTATIKNIKQNLFGAFIYNIIGIPLAAGLFYPITGWLLAPAFASAAMALSSVTVVTNANRLRFFKP